MSLLFKSQMSLAELIDPLSRVLSGKRDHEMRMLFERAMLAAVCSGVLADQGLSAGVDRATAAMTSNQHDEASKGDKLKKYRFTASCDAQCDGECRAFECSGTAEASTESDAKVKAQAALTAKVKKEKGDPKTMTSITISVAIEL